MGRVESIVAVPGIKHKMSQPRRLSTADKILIGSVPKIGKDIQCDTTRKNGLCLIDPKHPQYLMQFLYIPIVLYPSILWSSLSFPRLDNVDTAIPHPGTGE